MVATTGRSRIVENRRFEDYRSMKQHYQYRHTKEFIISGTGTTAGAAFAFTSDTIDYIGTEAQAYIRTEAQDDNQKTKYVYLVYQDDDGVIQAPVTADFLANTETEVVIGSTNFWRIREMYSEVESATGGGKAIVLTDDDYDANSHWGFIEDNSSEWVAEQYFVPSATQVEHSYLGRVIAKAAIVAEAAAAQQGIILTVAYTPKALNLGEVSAAANITTVVEFGENLDWQPLIELEPATSVTFSWNHNTTAHDVWFEATFLEVYV